MRLLANRFIAVLPKFVERTMERCVKHGPLRQWTLDLPTLSSARLVSLFIMRPQMTDGMSA